ncbi:MAG: D-sedoheptulose 7-phosphate isomerase [Melioribacteraceae bacterium]|nr:D-sedoheptulose 7-phosphate isomerase [Melioribacteraceae bacterium]
MRETILNELQSHKDTIEKVIAALQDDILTASELVIATLKAGNKILLFGNGGSAGDAQHIAAELTGRYKSERGALPAIALTTDTSAITAIANDYGYWAIFERQVEALATKGDLLIGISTSGNSENVIKAFQKGKLVGCNSIALTGKNGGKIIGESDYSIIVPSDDTARIQEMHILIGHIICQIIDDNFK